ncbi:MAG: AbrB/MazE/SpoVT family DNA-binding domain-containing protein [Cyanobacteria bacterium J06560_6]
MVSAKLRRIGDSLGVTFPKELLEELNVKEGDELYLVKTKQINFHESSSQGK